MTTELKSQNMKCNYFCHKDYSWTDYRNGSKIICKINDNNLITILFGCYLLAFRVCVV